jgi:hypothetical protein
MLSGSADFSRSFKVCFLTSASIWHEKSHSAAEEFLSSRVLEGGARVQVHFVESHICMVV